MNNTIFYRIKEARIHSSLTIEMAYKKLLVSRQSLINYESGKTQPTSDILLRMCNLYNVSPNYLLFGYDETPIKIIGSLKRKAFFLLNLLIDNDISFDQFKKHISIENEKLKTIFVYCNAVLISNKYTKLEIIDRLLNYLDNIKE